eukprot:868641-Prymnesium_polylepis.1
MARRCCRPPSPTGFCAITDVLPIRYHSPQTELVLPPLTSGMNATVGAKAHLVAAEPHAVFVRVSVMDDRQEVAFESCVLGRLRRGYRVLQLRSPLGTRVELAFVFVRISAASERLEPNLWSTPRQIRVQAAKLQRRSPDMERLKADFSLLPNESSDADGMRAASVREDE